MRFCDVRWCFRKGKFPVDGTIWNACYRHHPTSPVSPPSVEAIHKDFLDAHPDMEFISNVELATYRDEDPVLARGAIEVAKVPFGFYQGEGKDDK